MPHLRASVTGPSAGFDASRSLLVLPVGGTTDLLLCAGATLDPRLDGDAAEVVERPVARPEATNARLTGWERTNDVRAFRFKGKTVGDATFNAFLPGTTLPYIQPLTVRVTTDQDRRQGGDGPKGGTSISPALTVELAGMHFRDALVRLAEDQMNSTIGRDPKGGFGRYGLPELGPPDKAGVQHKVNWCGAFVHWLYRRVSDVQGVSNPFEANVNSLASPQKAISFALHRPTSLTLLRFAGPDPYGWSWPPKRDAKGAAVGDSPALAATFNEITPVSGPPRTGDICLVRVNNDPAAGWKHVCMVLSPPDGEGAFSTFDGNQGGTWNPTTGAVAGCIGKNQHDANDKVDGGVSKFVFIAASLPNDDRYVSKLYSGS